MVRLFFSELKETANPEYKPTIHYDHEQPDENWTRVVDGEEPR
jgi:hypothetical protein